LQQWKLAKGDEIMKRTTLYALLFSTTLLVGICYAGSAPKAAEKDIVDTAVAAGNFTTLVSAVQAAGLVETLKGEGPFTVFAQQMLPLPRSRRIS
jgi:hypothetical protein